VPKLDFSRVTSADEAAEEPEGNRRSTFPLLSIYTSGAEPSTEYLPNGDLIASSEVLG
jgi:hypothetical protein